MSALHRAGALAAVAIGGLMVGRLIAAPEAAPPPPPSSPVAVRAPAPGVAVHAGAPGIDRAALREELRLALAELDVPVSGGADLAAPAAPAAEPTVAQHEAADAGDDLVAGAIDRGRWQDQDAARLRDLLPVMTADQRAATLDALAAAINRGEVEPDGPVMF